MSAPRKRRLFSRVWPRLWSSSQRQVPHRRHELLETNVEPLEARLLLSASPTNWTPDSVDFVGTALDADALYLRTSGSTLEYRSGSTGSYSSDLDNALVGSQTLSLTPGAHINIDLGIGSDTIFIDESLQHAVAANGGTLSFVSDSTSADKLVGPGGVWELNVAGDGIFTAGSGAIVGDGNALSIESSGSFEIMGDMLNDFDVNISVTDHISIANGVTVSTRQIADNNHLTGNSNSDSYDITFDARIIEVGAGARILAHASNSFSAGDVTFNAHDDATGIDTPTYEIDIVNAESRISLDGATITGRDIRFEATAESASLFYDDESPTAAVLNFLDGLSEIGGVAVTHSTAEIHVGNGTTIDGTSVDFTSRADTESNIATLGTALAVAYGESNPHAKIMIQDNVNITSAGDISLSTLADSQLDVTAKQALYPTKAQSNLDVTLAVGIADIQSQVEIAGNATLASGGNVGVNATMIQSHNVSSSGAAYEDGAVGGAVAYSSSIAGVHAFVDGTIVAEGNVAILANSTTPVNDASSQAGVGSGFVASKIIHASDAVNLSTSLEGFMRNKQPKSDSAAGGTQKFALSAAFTYSDHAADAVARVGDNASVTAATGSVEVLATIESVPETSAITTVDSDKLNAANPKGNTKENSSAVSVIVASFDNSTDAYIGEGATVNAYSDFTVSAETKLPHEIQWLELSMDSVADKLNANLGIQNGVFTSWAQSNAKGTKSAIAASLNFQTFDTSSHAYIASNASVNENLESDHQQIHIEAQNVVEAVHLAGNIGLPFGQTTGGSGAGGGYLQAVYTNDVEADIRSGARVFGSSLFVSADSKTRNISLAISGGVADKLAFNGAGSLAQVDNLTMARIDDGATVVTDDAVLTVDLNGDQRIALDTNGDGVVTTADRDITSATDEAYGTNLNQLVVAEDDTLLFNLSGGVTKSQSVGIGFTVGVNEVTRNTQALIGNELIGISDGHFSPDVGVDSDNNIHLGYAHGFSTGDEVVYSSAGGVEIAGLTNGKTYVVTVVDASTVRLEKSLAAASNAPESLFAPASDVNGTGNADTINLGYAHNYATGDSVIYRNGGGQSIGGLVNGTTYYVVVIDAFSIALSESEEAARDSAAAPFALAGVDGGNDTIHFSSSHDFRTGDAVVYSNGGGTSIRGLVDGNTYFVRVSESDSIRLAETPEAAKLGDELIELNEAAGTGSGHTLRRDVRIELDSASATGDSHSVRLSVAPTQSTNESHAILRTLDPAASANVTENAIDLGYQHGFATGQAVVYDNGGGESIGGLASGETYFVVVVNGTTIRLADTAADALAADAVVVSIDLNGTTGTDHGFGGVFRDQPAVDGIANTIRFGQQHGLATGDAVTYDSAGGAAIGGLIDGQTYYAIVLDSTIVQLASSEANATSATAIDLDPATAGSTSHALRGVDDSAGTVTAGGSVRVAAVNRGSIGSISLAGALTNDSPTGAKKTQSKEAAGAKTKATKGISVSGDISFNTVTDTTIAAIRDASVVTSSELPTDVGVSAENRANIYAASGSVAIASAQSSSAGLAGSYTVNKIGNETSAAIENSDVSSVSGDTYANAISSGEIRSLSASGSGVTRNAVLSIAGQVSVNDIASTTNAHMSEGSTVVAAGDVEVTATDNGLIHAIAGAATFGGKLGIGAAIAANRVQNVTSATVSESQIIAGADLTLDAATIGEVRAITAAVGASTQGLTAEFAVANNSIANDTSAQLMNISATDGAAAGGNMTVNASDSATILAITGGIAASSGTAGLGGGYGKNSVRNVTSAKVENATASALGSFDVSANSDATIKSITVGGAGAQSFAAGGSWSRNEVRNETSASALNSDISAFNIDALNMTATDDATIQAISGAAAIATTGGSVGAAIAENIVANSTSAVVEGSVVDSDSGAVIIDSSSTALIETITVGGAGGQVFALGGSFSFNDVHNVIDANVSGGSDITVGSVEVKSADTATIRGIAGSVALAGSAAAIGAAVATNDIRNQVSSYVDGSSVVATGGFVTVDATSTAVIQTISAGVAASQVEVSGGVSLNRIANSISAFVSHSDVAGVSGLTVTASDDATIEALSGKAGGAATASFGGSAALNEISNTIHAYADHSSLDSDGGSIELLAQSRATIATISASGSIAGAVSVTGSIATSSIGNDVQAYLDSMDVDAFGNVTVVADTLNDANTYAGAIQIGGALGIGGTFADTNLNNTTNAFIVDSKVDAAGNGASMVPGTDGSNILSEVNGVAVVAISTSSMNVLAGNGSGGGAAAVAATLTFQTSDDTTEAYIIRSDINTNDTGGIDQDVLVSAFGRTAVDVKAGGLGIGGTVGVGATHDKTIITNTTKSYIDDQSLVVAQRNIDVTANSEERLNSITLSGAISGSVSVAGNVVINEVESTTEAYVDGSTISSQGNVTVATRSDVYLGVQEDGSRPGILSGALGIDFVALGVGGAVSDNSISNATTTRIDQSKVYAESLAVTADSREDVFALAISGAGSLAIAAVGNFSSAASDSETTASIGESAFVSARDDVMLAANAVTKADAQAYGVAGSLILAGGATFADADISPTVTALVGANASVAAGDDIVVTAVSASDVTTKVVGAGAGLATGSLVEASSTITNATKVNIGEGAQIVARDELDVSAVTWIDADSQSTSHTIAGAALGDSSSDTVVNSNTTIDVEELAQLIANVTQIHAKVTRLDANATALFNSTISLATAAKAEATVLANSVAEVISRGADIAGYSRLELIARQNGVGTDTNSQVDAGIVPFVSSISRNNVDINSNVDVQAGSVLRGTNAIVEGDSANLIRYVKDSGVDSITIDLLEGALNGVNSVLAGAQSVFDAAQSELADAQDALDDAQDELQSAQDYLQGKQDALDDTILDLCGSSPSAFCLWTWRVILSPLYAALELAQLGVSAAQTTVSGAQTTLNLAQSAFNTASTALNNAQTAVNNAIADLGAAFGEEIHGVARRDSDVKLNGDFYAGAIADRLVINPDGTLSGGTSGITGQASGQYFEIDPIIVTDLVTASNAVLTAKSIGGSLTGSLNIHESIDLSKLRIVNNSGKHLKINDIVTNTGGVIATAVTKQASSNSLATPLSTAAEVTTFDIVSGSDVDVVVAGDVDAADRNVLFTTDGDIRLAGTIATNGTLTVEATAGSITNSGPNEASLVAGKLDLYAAHGNLGSAINALRTDIGELQNAVADGLIAISEVTGDLKATSVTSTSGGVQLDAETGSLRIDSIRATNGDVTLSALGSVIDVKSGGAPNVVADRITVDSIDGGINVVVDAGSTDGAVVATAEQNIFIVGRNDALVLGPITSYSGGVYIGSDGDIRATGDVSGTTHQFYAELGSLFIGDGVRFQANGTGNGILGDTIFTALGNVKMSNGSLVVAHRLSVQAGDDLFLNTSVDRLHAVSSALESQSDIVINEQDDIELDYASAANGAIRLIAGGTITAQDVRSTNDSNGRNVGLISRTGDILVTAIQAGASSGQVSLSAAGNIVNTDNDEPTDVVAALVVLSSGGTIDVSTDATEVFEFSDGKKIRINTDRSLELFLYSTADVVAVADGDILASYIETSGANINLKSNDSNIFVGSLTTTHRNGKVRIQANGTDGLGNIVQYATRGGDAAAITATKSVDLRAKGDITLAGIVDAGVGNVSINATGDLAVTDSATIQAGKIVKASTRLGNISILGDVAATKSVDVRSRGNLNIAGTISTELRDIKLNADGEIAIDDEATVVAGNNVALKTRAGDISVFGAIVAGIFDSRSTRGNIKIDAGAVADITLGEFDALGEVTVVERRR